MILSVEQRNIINEDDAIVVKALAGCLGIDTPIMLYNGGMKKVQDIKVGDIIMGDDFTPRNVLSLCRGKEEMYKIIPSKGKPFICNKSHILTLDYYHRKNNRYQHDLIDIKLDDFLKQDNTLLKNKYFKKYKLQKALFKEDGITPKRFSFTVEKLEVDNYYGFNIDGNNRFLLGDYTITHNSGKTSTLYHFIKTRPKDSKILYIVFNKSMQVEAEKKFEDITDKFVHVKTAHSMAYRSIVFKKGYTVGDITPEYIIERYNCEYTIALHVQKYITYYTSSPILKVKDLNYKKTITNDESYALYYEFEDEIVKMVREIIADMYNNVIPITHDYYLKLWFMSNPRLDLEYDYILLDESQDSSEILLEIFKNQKTKKIAVGDEHQQIYSWRNAINSLNKLDGFKVLTLTTSYRFEQNIADLATKVIKWKRELLYDDSLNNFKIVGNGIKKITPETRAVISRTNVGLLVRALTDVIIEKKVHYPYFEGGINGYSMNAMYTPINDIKAIDKGTFNKIKTERLKGIKSMEELIKFVKLTEDILFIQAIELYDLFGDKVTGLISKLKEKCVENKKDSDLIYTTTHKCKGMEYDYVEVLDDFKIKKDLLQMLITSDDKEKARMLVNEEINLLYVAITRSRGDIKIPLELKNELNEEE